MAPPHRLLQGYRDERLQAQQSSGHLAAPAVVVAPAPAAAPVYMYPPMRERYCGPISWVVGARLLVRGGLCAGVFVGRCVCVQARPPTRQARGRVLASAHAAPRPAHRCTAGICLLPCIFLCPIDERDVYPTHPQPVMVTSPMQQPAVAVVAR